MFATASMCVLVVVKNRVAFNGVNLSDEELVYVKIAATHRQVFGLESLWFLHEKRLSFTGWQRKRQSNLLPKAER